MKMIFEPKAIAGSMQITPKRFADTRGAFLETYRKDLFAQAGILDDFVQDNQSWSAKRGTVRGLHFQKSPHAQSKLVRVLQGRILDVVVDLRRASATFGAHIAVNLDAQSGAMLYVPSGCAHGFCTLEDDCVVAYKCNSYYAPAHEGGLLWADPALGISWPVAFDEAILSDKDREWPALAELGAIIYGL